MTSDRMRIGMAMAALLVSVACAGPSDDAVATDAAAPATGSGPMTAALEADVKRAAAIANATLTSPAKSDSILAANDLTPDALEAMMYRIAADSAASAEYRRLTSGN